MRKECVFNELSIHDIDEHDGDVRELLEVLAAVRTIVGSPRLSVWQDTLDREKALGKRLLGMLSSVKVAPREMDSWRKTRSMFDKAERFADELAEDVRLGSEAARGLGRARRFDGIALSLRSAERWLHPRLPVTVISLTQAGGCEEVEDWVRHAAEEAHLAEHRTSWRTLDAADRLRILLACTPTSHVPASSYRSGKHTNGTTNEQRERNARGPGGVSQYFAFRAGQPVTDEVIRAWQEEALDRVRRGGVCTIEERGATYHVFCDLGEPVGYEGGSGLQVSTVRVEWSAGAVHSHPRLPTP